MSTRTGPLAVVTALAVAAGLTLSGCAGGGAATAIGTGAAPSSAASPAPSSSAASSTPPSAAASSLGPGRLDRLQDPTGASPAASVGAPTRVRIPGIGVDSTLENLRRDAAGVLAAPKDWQRAGWYTESPVPGQRGPSVIAGHLTAPDGPGVFYRLPELRPGDPVTVTGADGRDVHFTVTRVLSADRVGIFPTEQIYGPTPDAQLRLITCDGHWDPALGHWTRNLVVFATADG
ncbi:class F sortase [Tersicoccus sp. Bi-70]|uniref:class F sortase n=1 Tax=Tersicoccus sp. Bi-70 TaxID=1897634 RepID=UPI000975E1DE|nr:class F sortase [Tersicoccus sp. Bi-70]OMH33087.1 hypothetical protein BGP79_05895 [Tersicoccus sp. Bi-70]